MRLIKQAADVVSAAGSSVLRNVIVRKLPSDIDGPRSSVVRYQTESLDMIETTLERMEEARKMTGSLQDAAYKAICDDLRDCLAESQEKICEREQKFARAMQVLVVVANTLPAIGGNERSVHSLLKDIKAVIG